MVFSPGSRPQHLLVYINPYGGKQQGKRIYEQKVAPLFAQAGISTHVIGMFWTLHFLSLGFRDDSSKAPGVFVVCYSYGVR